MSISIFLARTLGLYLLIASLALMINFRYLQMLAAELVKNRLSMLFLSVVTLIVGILLINAHNIWVMDWRVIITIIAWLTFIKGLVRFYFPDYIQKYAELYFLKQRVFIISGIVCFILALILLYFGYFA